MIQRFVERLQLWWQAREQEQRGKNPLTWLAMIALVLLGLDLYKMVTSHHVALSAALSDALFLAFLILYARHSRFAWLVIPAFGGMGLLLSPLIFFSSEPRYPLRIRFLTFALIIGFSLAVIAYGFLVRRRYELYLHDHSEAAQTSNQAMQPTAGRARFELSMTSILNQQRRALSPAVADLVSR